VDTCISVAEIICYQASHHINECNMEFTYRIGWLMIYYTSLDTVKGSILVPCT
jgi:hypothetical protein